MNIRNLTVELRFKNANNSMELQRDQKRAVGRKEKHHQTTAT